MRSIIGVSIEFSVQQDDEEGLGLLFKRSDTRRVVRVLRAHPRERAEQRLGIVILDLLEEAGMEFWK